MYEWWTTTRAVPLSLFCHLYFEREKRGFRVLQGLRMHLEVTKFYRIIDTIIIASKVSEVFYLKILTKIRRQKTEIKNWKKKDEGEVTLIKYEEIVRVHLQRTISREVVFTKSLGSGKVDHRSKRSRSSRNVDRPTVPFSCTPLCVGKELTEPVLTLCSKANVHSQCTEVNLHPSMILYVRERPVSEGPMSR